MSRTRLEIPRADALAICRFITSTIDTATGQDVLRAIAAVDRDQLIGGVRLRAIVGALLSHLVDAAPAVVAVTVNGAELSLLHQYFAIIADDDDAPVGRAELAEAWRLARTFLQAEWRVTADAIRTRRRF